jgi:DNA-binding response OmpR family regulator
MKTILIIEDDKDVRESTAEILELAEYRVLQAEDGKRGVEIARNELPDLVLCDIMMPDLDGYGVLHLLGRNQQTAAIPFIFLTAMSGRKDVRKGMDLGADDYLTKPFEESELLNTIDGRLKRSERFRQDLGSGLDGLNRFMDEARGLEALKDLGKDRKLRKVQKRDILFREGDELQQVLFIVSGTVRTYKLNSEGKTFVTGLHCGGDFIGHMSLFGNGRAMESAEAMDEGEVAMIPREDLLALLYRDSDVSMRFIRMLAREVQDKQQHLLQLAYASVRQRVARALLRVQDHSAKSGPEGPGLRITREDLAAMVGTATESVVRCLADFKGEGLIDIQGRDTRILSKTGLERVSRS